MNSEDDNQDQPNPTHDCVRRGQEDAQAQEERLEDPDDDVDLSREEGLQVRKRASVDSYVVHEVIRRQGHDELRRPALSLFWSGIAAGIAIASSVLGEGMLESALPDTPWRPIIASFGYTVGFLIVIMGRMQLFTESTLSATIPVATSPTLSNLLRLGRLWGIVFIANMLGTLFIMLLVGNHLVGWESHLEGMIAVSRPILTHTPFETVLGGIPAGFLLAAVAWSLPVGRGQEFWIILFFTYFVGLGNFAHVVAGSGEAWLLVVTGNASVGFAIFGFILPALLGNIIGGTLIFALLAHAQVSPEIENGRED
ncbi:formate/nitrite transporter family protein [Novosphingopyxis sp. YJ-S2-01]|uniref:formate/nitrite transporter family protein n=1 Tax=Novosphingopyxis sp. YJ-S2-01 TaxID=2794021 RepID=UPI0018DE35F8|nr:formate/nitrite transporter family protein [Novosphingopyxis sp. YJ-S2-01]MBH9537213.1 formate/nitrite transporter family protein [Novosphingopyxis sp. YJ-S2-01]